jgi:hypothetical protein
VRPFVRTGDADTYAIRHTVKPARFEKYSGLSRSAVAADIVDTSG